MWFFNATVNSWQHLLEDDELKNIIIKSLVWFHENKRADIHAFVIMPNHLHLVWSAIGNFNNDMNARALLKFTGHEFRKHLLEHHPSILGKYISNQGDREFHFWERRPKSIEILSKDIAWQKVVYCHQNPIKSRWNLCEFPEDYKYSSAGFYAGKENDFTFLTNFMDYI